MAIATISALRGSQTATRGRGRPPVEADATDNMIELNALRREAREAANVLPFARFVHRMVALDSDPRTVTAQGVVVNFLERQARRHEPDPAA